MEGHGLSAGRGTWAMVATGCAAAALSLGPGCAGDKAAPRARRVEAQVKAYPDVLRGTVGAETTMLGIQPVLVSGLGIMVGLNGTGGGEVPERIAAEIEQLMGRRGISKNSQALAGTRYAGMTPRQMLRDPSVAVVLVQAGIPPGLPNGATFDVYVRALNSSSTTSLEGGVLWTTELRLGPATGFGGAKSRLVGEARGPIFINPFVDPAQEKTVVSRRQGRILDGGRVTGSLELMLVLDDPSHARARSIASAINTRFPVGADDLNPAARGRDDRIILLSVPRRYQDDLEQFVNLVRYTQIDQMRPRYYAQGYVEALKSQIRFVQELSWTLQALGPAAIDALREMYDYPELGPRVAALRAGARLGDPRTAQPLTELANNGPTYLKPKIIELLTGLDAGPKIDLTLRGLLGDEDVDTRIAAYEALATRRERVELSHLVSLDRTMPGMPTSPEDMHRLALLAGSRFSGGSIQGVSRRFMGGKFLLDKVEAPSEPMVYITQQGKPRIVLFGESALERPLLASIWSDRLMLASEGPDDPVRLYYHDYRTGQTTRQEVDPRLDRFIEFLAHDPTPEDPRPGLGLAYSEVVGALYELGKAGAIDAKFVTEQDRLMARLARATQPIEARVRPETEALRDDRPLFEQYERFQIKPEEGEPTRRIRIIPLGPAQDKPDG